MTDSTTEQVAGVLLDEFVRQYCTKLEQLNYGPSDDQCLPAIDQATSPTHGRTRRCLGRAHAGHRGGTGARRGLARRPSPVCCLHAGCARRSAARFSGRAEKWSRRPWTRCAPCSAPTRPALEPPSTSVSGISMPCCGAGKLPTNTGPAWRASGPDCSPTDGIDCDWRPGLPGRLFRHFHCPLSTSVAPLTLAGSASPSSAATRRLTRASAASSSFSRTKVRSNAPARQSTAAPPSDGRSSSLRVIEAKRSGEGIGGNGKGVGRGLSSADEPVIRGYAAPITEGWARICYRTGRYKEGRRGMIPSLTPYKQ